MAAYGEGGYEYWLKSNAMHVVPIAFQCDAMMHVYNKGVHTRTWNTTASILPRFM